MNFDREMLFDAGFTELLLSGAFDDDLEKGDASKEEIEGLGISEGRNADEKEEIEEKRKKQCPHCGLEL